MIVLLALVGAVAFRGASCARRDLRAGARATRPPVDGRRERGTQHELEHEPWRQKLTRQAAWADAASYTMADITMLRRELVIGYVVAGFLTVLVPMECGTTCSSTATASGRRSRTCIVGPFIAFISFVCSIGNVPMAAALWHGGISFGGVISFIFADLIALAVAAHLPQVLRHRAHGAAVSSRSGR